MYTNGAAPTNVGSIDLSNTGINLHSGHVFTVVMAYDGTTLNVSITDTVTGATATQAYTVNIPNLVGGSTAYVGFTGGTGGLSADQRILNWTYTPAILTPPAPTNLTAIAGVGQVSLNWTPSSGAVSYNIYRSPTFSNADPGDPIQTGVTGSSYTDTGLSSQTTYTYWVTAVGAGGESISSNQISATTLIPNYDFSNGFVANGSMKLNGSAQINGPLLQLTNGGGSEAGSAFSSTPLGVTQFTTQFSFQLINPNADGFTFAIQGATPSALGGTGAGLGYGPQTAGGTGGIANSVAVRFNLYNSNSTGLYVNGAPSTNGGSINLNNTGINLHSGHVFNVAMGYDGTTLKVIITDTVTGATASQSYAVNIPSIVGGNTAYVGFTGGTGSQTATQNILSWAYTALFVTPSAPLNVTAAASLGHVSLNWTASPALSATTSTARRPATAREGRLCKRASPALRSSTRR